MHKIGVCIVGGGPAGFLMAEKLSNRIENVIINIIEREMLPFGLIRWGVSPDHPEIRVRCTIPFTWCLFFKEQHECFPRCSFEA